ncbi:MAG: hypothetical protein ABIK82_00270, partial [Pseudomonadota bacterium]
MKPRSAGHLHYKGFPTLRKRFEAFVVAFFPLIHTAWANRGLALRPGQGQAAFFAAWRSAPLTRPERRYAHARLDATVFRIQACRPSG